MTPPSSGRADASDALTATRQVAAQRRTIASLLTIAMVVVYFGFIALVAFRPTLLATPLGDGLTIGIVLGALVIVAAWLLTLTYVSWAHRVYDPALAQLRANHGESGNDGESAA